MSANDEKMAAFDAKMAAMRPPKSVRCVHSHVIVSGVTATARQPSDDQFAVRVFQYMQLPVSNGGSHVYICCVVDVTAEELHEIFAGIPEGQFVICAGNVVLAIRKCVSFTQLYVIFVGRRLARLSGGKL